ncbi:MAG: F0F1 ATP synthase subunit A [Candidatus Omnitrophica bacterium]|nr:F0F1 ATP synthase subunit A [Candidatus Omnitrophota bacterium]
MEKHEALANATHDAAHAAAHHGHHEAHELPNLLAILKEHFPDLPGLDFLLQWQNIFFSALAALLISAVAIRAARRKSLIPDSLRNFVEILMEGIAGFVTGILGEKHAPKHIPFLGTLFFYVLFMNWFGMIPFMKAPTSAWSTTAALGLITVVYVQAVGIREQGFAHYLKHIAGNPSTLVGWLLLPLMFCLNIILEIIAVPFSLSLRLFANISSEDRLLLKFAELNTAFNYMPFVFQIFANCLVILFSVIQAFVFMLLSTVYIALLLPHEHEHPEHDEASAHAH